MIINDEAPTMYDVVELYGHNLTAVMGGYPIWDETRRDWLNERIFQHFAYREIACETANEFSFLMQRTMCEMAPVFNPLFKALDADVDILSSYENASSSTSASTNSGRQLYSATPQTQLSGQENYATNLTDTDGTSDSTNATSASGRNAPVGDMATAWANSINNALYIVYNGLEPLFQQILELGGIATWQ